MTKKKPLKDRLLDLGLPTFDSAADVLGVGRRSLIRYASDDADVPQYLDRLITMFEKHGIPREFKTNAGS